MKLIKKEYLPVYSGAVLNFFLFGMSVVIIGTLLPEILQSFKWNYIQAGMVIGAGSISFFISAFIAGFLINRKGPGTVVITGLVIEAAGFFLFGLSSNFIFCMCMNLLIGFGQGSVEVASNYCTIQIEKKGNNHLMSFLHAGFSAGAVAAPILIGILLKSSGNWIITFRIFAVLLLAAAVYSWKVDLNKIHNDTDGENGKKERIVFRPFLIFTVITILLYVGVEIGLTNWITEYAVKVVKMKTASAAGIVSVFWLGLLAGRLVTPFIFRKISIPLQLILLSIITSISITVFLFLKTPLLLFPVIFVAGFGCSSIYPLIISILGQRYKSNRSVYIAFAATGGGIGSFLLPFIFSAMAFSLGIKTGFIMFAVMCVVLTVAALGMYISGRPKD